MSVRWGTYRPYDPGVEGLRSDLPKRDARAAFDRLMIEKSGRIGALRLLLLENGERLDATDDGLQRLNDWFDREVQADPANPGRLAPIWYSVVNDVALFLGDAIVERAPGVRWVFHDRGSRDLSFQRHVLVGFKSVPNPRYHVDIDLLVATHAHRIVAGLSERRDTFQALVRGAEDKA